MSDRPLTVKSSGSFVSGEQIKENIRAQRVAEEINKASTEGDKSKADEEDKKRQAEIDALLPKMVLSSFGEISYSLFKQLYAQVWDQIREKDHLALGYCTFTGDLLPGVHGVVRTLRSREAKGLLRWTPSFDRGDAKTELEFRKMKLVLGVVSFDGHTVAEVPEITPENAEKWVDIEIVKQKAAWLDSLPEEVLYQLSGLQMDLSNAMQFALRENLKNRLAPPALS